jgi:hypothetical protein
VTEGSQDRRRGEDRRSAPRPGTSERRKPGRPPKAPGEHYRTPTVSRKVKLPLALDASMQRVAVRLGITCHAVIVRAVRRLAEIEAAAFRSGPKTPPPADQT